MPVYRFLNDSDFYSLHNCFLEAFADYSVNMQMTEEQFSARLFHNGVRLESSVGVIEANEMIGFTINGFGAWQEKPTAYDAGTGIMSQFRGKGIAKDLFDFMLPKLKVRGVRQYLLEVIAANEAAVNLYRKLGFRETRKLAVFSLNKKLVQPPDKIANSVQIRKIENPDWRLFESFWNALPSWQNSVSSIKRSRNKKIFLGAFSGKQCIGYAAAFPASGSVLQLAVGKDFRRKGIGAYLLAALQNEVSTPEKLLRITNIDYSLKEMLVFCEALGFKHDLDQYEMTRDL